MRGLTQVSQDCDGREWVPVAEALAQTIVQSPGGAVPAGFQAVEERLTDRSFLTAVVVVVCSLSGNAFQDGAPIPPAHAQACARILRWSAPNCGLFYPQAARTLSIYARRCLHQFEKWNTNPYGVLGASGGAATAAAASAGAFPHMECLRSCLTLARFAQRRIIEMHFQSEEFLRGMNQLEASIDRLAPLLGLPRRMPTPHSLTPRVRGLMTPQQQQPMMPYFS